MGEIQQNQQSFTTSFGDHDSTMTEQFLSKFETSSATTTAGTTTTALTSSDIDMEGVQVEVSQLSIHDYKEQTNITLDPSTVDKDELMEDDDSKVPGLCEDDGTDLESGDEEETQDKGETMDDSVQIQSQSQESNVASEANNNVTDVIADNINAESKSLDQIQEQSPQATATTTATTTAKTSAFNSFPTEPSIIVMTDAVYSAVPVSSELHIIPHSSKGFNWNADLFMKPHQRRSLGVDEMYNAGDSGSSHDTTVSVHEIHLDDEESQQILPS